MLTLQRITITDFREHSETLKRLHEIFSRTLRPSMSYKEFRCYYFFHPPHYMDITFMLDGEETVGFISAVFYKHQLSGNMHTICKGALGLLEHYRRGTLTGWQLCLKYITYKFNHPKEEVHLVAFITNPVMYAMICKYAHRVYPRQGTEVPASIHLLKDALIATYRLQKRVIAPFVVQLHFHVPLNEAELHRIHASRDKDLQFYLSLNGNFQDHAGLLTIIPVSWHNVILTMYTAVFARQAGKLAKRLQARLRAGLQWIPDRIGSMTGRTGHAIDKYP